MTALFEAYDETGRLQLTTEAATYYVAAAYSVNTTSMFSGSYGELNITVPNATDLVAFRCTNGINISGYRTPTGYRFITQTPVCTIQIKILSLLSGLDPNAAGIGLQLFGPSGELTFSATEGMSFFLDSVSVYGEDWMGDVGEVVMFADNTNPYVVILGTPYVGYTGAQEQDAYYRIINIGDMSHNRVFVGSVTQNDWPSIPNSGFGISAPGTYTVAFVS